MEKSCLPTRREFLAMAAASAALSAYGRPILSMEAASLAEKLASDPRRPEFHLLPARNWMNDPNGPIYWNGQYHMFFQYNPHAAVWGDMHWYHSVSADMVRWKHQPVALAPTPDGPDAQGCFSGTAIKDGARAVAFYTGVVNDPVHATLRDGNSTLRESQCMAVAADAHISSWKKDPVPVIPAPPAGLEVTGFRDPSLLRQGDRWYMIVGSGIAGRGGMVLLYSSPPDSKQDLKKWKYEHVLVSGRKNDTRSTNPVDTGEMWECPDLFAVGDRHVLIYSTEGRVLWQSGHLDMATMLFHGDQQGVLDYGAFYAPKTQADADGRRILWGWVPERRPTEEYSAAGWAGMMSLPRVLDLDPEGRLRIRSAAQLASIRGPQVKASAANLRFAKANGELQLTLGALSQPVELMLAHAGGKVLTLGYNPSKRLLSFDEIEVPLRTGSPDKLALHLYLDGSVAEVIVNEAEAYTKRFYYPAGTAPDIEATLTGADGKVRGLALWTVKPISANRLTTEG